jgi:hypothetical protein
MEELIYYLQKILAMNDIFVNILVVVHSDAEIEL